MDPVTSCGESLHFDKFVNVGMEARMRKYRQVSPERAKVWTEKPPKYHQNRKVPVLYYLCRNRQLEHPHFMEVPLSSPDGLYLRGRLNNGKTNILLFSYLGGGRGVVFVVFLCDLWILRGCFCVQM